IGFEQVDVLPGYDAWRNALQECAKRERWHHAFGQTPDGAAGADVYGEDRERHVIVDGRGVELDVVDPDNFSAVNVDDLLIKQIAFEQEHAVGNVVRLPPREFARGANRRTG